MNRQLTTLFDDLDDRIIHCAICWTLLSRRENLRLRLYHINGGGLKVAMIQRSS
jgi:hypothetical protein